MAKTIETMVHFEGIWDGDNTSRIFRTIGPKATTFYVKSLSCGIATLDFIDFLTLTELAETVTGFFAAESNFEEEVLRVFERNGRISTFDGIRFEFCGETIVLYKDLFDEDRFYARLEHIMAKQVIEPNTTIVRFCKIDENYRIFLTILPKIFNISVSFENGIATVIPQEGVSIFDLAEAVAGCFADKSNFRREVLRVFNGDSFTGIKFKFNGVTLVVTKENADKDKIFEKWDAEQKAKEFITMQEPVQNI